MSNVFGRLLARNRVFIVACAWVLGLFQFLLCALVAELDLQNVLAQVMALVPPVMRAAIEQMMLGGSVPGVLAFGWGHPVTHALVMAIAIALAARAIAGEVENGVLELVLAHPISRLRYLGAQVAFALAALVFVLAVGGLGTLFGQQVFAVHAFGAGRLLPLLLNLLLLQTALYGITLFFSAWGREGGRVAMIGVLVGVISYFIAVIAAFWPRAAFLAPWSLHGHYDPRVALVQGATPTGALLTLGAVTAVSIGAAGWRFASRDLP